MIKKKQRQQIIQRICFGGCNWDAMLLWMYNDGKEPSIDVNSSTPKDICEGKPTRGHGSNSTIQTGVTEKDKLANVYDLLGCNSEFSMTAEGIDCRTRRSADVWDDEWPIGRYAMGYPSESAGDYSSRIILYM